MIRAKGGADRFLVEEKVYNISRRSSDPVCQSCVVVEKSRDFLGSGAPGLENTLQQSGDIFFLRTTVNGERLYEKLHKMENANLPSGKLTAAIAMTLGSCTDH